MEKSRSITGNKSRSIVYDQQEPAPQKNFAIAVQIQFAYDSAELHADSKTTLSKIAEVLDDPELSDKSLVLAGHTDSKGEEAYNEELGYKRAVAVRDYMAQLNVGKHRMQVVSYGETRPFEKGDTEAAINRRVEFLDQIY